MSGVPGEMAAGGVVWCRGEDGIEVLLVHRPRYDDWTFPKGKIESGESFIECAGREVLEETGVTPVIGCYLGRVSYCRRSGLLKEVHYWAMRAEEGTFVPSSEVDRVVWVSERCLESQVSYDTERALVARLQYGWTGMPDRILLTRHANAGLRGSWGEDDSERPLSDRGRSQARALVDQLRVFDIDTIVTSRAARCLQTVAPLADTRQIVPEISRHLWEEAGTDEVRAVLEGRPGRTRLLCSHRPIVRTALRRLVGNGRDLPFGKGSTWVFDFEGSEVVAANYLSAPS